MSTFNYMHTVKRILRCTVLLNSSFGVVCEQKKMQDDMINIAQPHKPNQMLILFLFFSNELRLSLSLVKVVEILSKKLLNKPVTTI